MNTPQSFIQSSNDNGTEIKQEEEQFAIRTTCEMLLLSHRNNVCSCFGSKAAPRSMREQLWQHTARLWQKEDGHLKQNLFVVPKQ